GAGDRQPRLPAALVLLGAVGPRARVARLPARPRSLAAAVPLRAARAALAARRRGRLAARARRLSRGVHGGLPAARAPRLPARRGEDLRLSAPRGRERRRAPRPRDNLAASHAPAPAAQHPRARLDALPVARLLELLRRRPAVEAPVGAHLGGRRAGACPLPRPLLPRL